MVAACGPVNFVTRNPGVVAAGILPIQILSGGRAICNVASGDSAVAARRADRICLGIGTNSERVAWAHMQSGKGVDLSQQPEILRRVASVLRDRYDYRFHRPDAPPENLNSAVCDEEFGEWMGIGGPPSYVLDRLGQLVDMGIDFFMTALPLPEREPFAAHVMPALRSLRI